MAHISVPAHVFLANECQSSQLQQVCSKAEANRYGTWLRWKDESATQGQAAQATALCTS